jgi:hypothetical protein
MIYPSYPPLYPAPYTEMFGRHDVEAHGDNALHNQSASLGCLITDKKCRAKIPSGEIPRVTW